MQLVPVDKDIRQISSDMEPTQQVSVQMIEDFLAYTRMHAEKAVHVLEAVRTVRGQLGSSVSYRIMRAAENLPSPTCSRDEIIESMQQLLCLHSHKQVDIERFRASQLLTLAQHVLDEVQCVHDCIGSIPLPLSMTSHWAAVECMPLTCKLAALHKCLIELRHHIDGTLQSPPHSGSGCSDQS